MVSWASPRVAGTAETTAGLGTMLFACTLLAAQRHPGTCSVVVQEAGQRTTVDERRQREEEGDSCTAGGCALQLQRSVGVEDDEVKL